MIAACKKNGVILAGVHQRRFFDSVREFKKAVDGGRLGTITLAEIDAQVKQLGKDLGGHVECFQTNFEGEMVERIHRAHMNTLEWMIILIINKEFTQFRSRTTIPRKLLSSIN